MQHNSLECSVAQEGAALLSKVQWSLVGCSYIAQWKIDTHGGPSLGLKELILFLEIVYFFHFWVSIKAVMGGRGRAVPCLAC